MWLKKQYSEQMIDIALEQKAAIELIYRSFISFEFTMRQHLNILDENHFHYCFLKTECAFLRHIIDNEFKTIEKQANKTLKKMKCPLLHLNTIYPTHYMEFNNTGLFLVYYYLFFKQQYKRHLTPLRIADISGFNHSKLNALCPKYIDEKMELLSSYYVSNATTKTEMDNIAQKEFEQVVDFYYANNHFSKMQQMPLFMDIGKRNNFNFNEHNARTVLDNIKDDVDNVISFNR